MKKHLLSLFALSAALVGGVTSAAAQEVEIESTVEEEASAVEIGIVDKNSAEVTIEDFTYDFYTNGKAYVKKYNGTATEVTIPASITVEDASVDVVGIGEGAFEGNTTIQKIHLARNNSYQLGARAFKGCSALTILNWSATGATDNAKSDKFFYPSTTTIPESAFEGCSAATNIYNRYTNKVAVGQNAFKGCSSAKYIYLYTTSIAANAFEGCSLLERLYLYDNASIEDDILKDCSALKYVLFLGGTVPTLTENALADIASSVSLGIDYQYITDAYVEAMGNKKGQAKGYVTFNSTVGFIRAISAKTSFSLNNSNYEVFYVKSVAETTDGVTVEVEATPTKVLPANTAVIVRYKGSSTGVFFCGSVVTTPEISYTNYLTPVAEDTEVVSSGDTNYYILPAKLAKDADITTAFTKVTTANTLTPGSAYLKVVSGVATGIDVVKTVAPITAVDNAVYSLSGVRVENPQKGIYIRGGKKFVVK